METIYLKLDSIEANYCINFGDQKYIKTPAGNLLLSKNKKLIESTIYDLQKYEEIDIEEDHYISGEPLERISLYTLLSTQIDFYSGEKKLTIDEIDLSIDPFLNLSPGPEKIDQLHQWRKIIQNLESEGFDFLKLQYYSEDEKLKNQLKEQICLDFNASSKTLKSVFINIATIFRSNVGSWCFCFKNLSADVFATALKYTVDFQFQIEEEMYEEISRLNEDEEKFFNDNYDKEHKKLKNYITKKNFNDRLEVFSIGKKFIEVSTSENPFISKINNGESKTVEFKETLSLDVRKKKDKSYKPIKENYIELAVLKTIAGFLNSEGGELFIGVNDHSQILGVRDELEQFHKSSIDKMLLHLKNLIKSNIGASLSNFYDINIRNLDNHQIIQVECFKSDKEVFIKGKDFYVRSGPSTDKLEGKDLIDYTKSRFSD